MDTILDFHSNFEGHVLHNMLLLLSKTVLGLEDLVMSAQRCRSYRYGSQKLICCIRLSLGMQ